MTIATRTKHVRRYAELARLMVRYGRSDLVRQMGADSIDGVALDDDCGPAKAEELASDLERLGPTYIKLGQLLSTRVDLIPAAYAKALARLQDDVEPVPVTDVERVFADELGLDTRTAFASFDPKPLASASLGQVHRAELRSGRSVVVKVQRPDIVGQIADDIEVITEIATFLDGHTEAGRRFGFAELVAQFHRSLRDELDYKREAGNLERLSEIVASYPLLVVPKPVHDFTSTKVLTMDYLPGRKVTEVGPLGRLDVDGAGLADQLFRAYLDQILVEGFFHADPHPGNISVMPDGRLALLDLGMVARVPASLQDSLIKLLVAVSAGRGEEAARVTISMGRPLDDFDEASFVRGASDLVTRNHLSTARDIEAGGLVMELTRLSGETGLRLPPELAMLGKALLNLDQVAAALDPDFSPSEVVQDHATSVLQSRMTPTRERLFTAALEAREFVEELPGRVNKLMDAAATGQLKVNVDAFDEVELLRGLQKVANRITMGLLLASLIMGAAMLTRVETSSRLFGYPSVAIIAFFLASLGAAALLWSIIRTDHRRPPNP
ncbi:MAG TPA: AarF/UbiB family protein [Acidimicrobiales bacterium]|nr:AarF/UbiB family protein [Acidimicrobiales bacterium]